MARLSTEPTTATVDGFTHGGEGVVRIDGKAVFVPGALPDETVVVRVVDDRKRWARAELMEVVEPAAGRVEPPCPYVPDCGGCNLQHADVDLQLQLKTRVVREQLQRLGRIDAPPVADCLPVGPALGYRSSARLHADDRGRLGFHRAGSNEVVPIDRCIVLDDATDDVRDLVGDAPAGVDEVRVRAAGPGDRAVVVSVTDNDLPTRWLDDLAGQHDGLQVGVDVATDDDPSSTPSPPPRHTAALDTHDVLTEHVTCAAGTFNLHVALDGFFQGSAAGAGTLVDAVLAACATVGDGVAGLDVWDLYAGVGLFAVPLADAGAHVTAVEVDATAVELLRVNAANAKVADRVEAGADDVARFVRRAHRVLPDIVVLDPPRSGAGTDVIDDIAACDPALVVYVACDPAALARDARRLGELGWRLEHAQPYDLFPMTHHVEVVARFRRSA